MEQKVKIGFLGAGNMGTAIMKGIAGSTLAAQVELYAYDRMTEKIAALTEIGVTACCSEAEVVQQCERRITIPMKGDMESLNAAMAAGIMMWEMTKPR